MTGSKFMNLSIRNKKGSEIYLISEPFLCWELEEVKLEVIFVFLESLDGHLMICSLVNKIEC